MYIEYMGKSKASIRVNYYIDNNGVCLAFKVLNSQHKLRNLP